MDFDVESEEEDSDSDIEMGENGERTERNEGRGSIFKKSSRPELDLEPIVGILNHLADNGKLQFFMYALPGEPCEPLPDDAWQVLQRMSDTLQGLYIELVTKHWVSSVFAFSSAELKF